MVHIGLPLSHEQDGISPISWRTLNLDMQASTWEKSSELMNAYWKSIKAIEHYQRMTFHTMIIGLPELLAQKGR